MIYWMLPKTISQTDYELIIEILQSHFCSSVDFFDNQVPNLRICHIGEPCEISLYQNTTKEQNTTNVHDVLEVLHVLNFSITFIILFTIWYFLKKCNP